MKKIIFSFVLVFIMSSVAFAVSDKYGIGINYNMIDFSDEWGYAPQPELSLRGIFNNFSLDITGTYNNLIDSKVEEGFLSTLSLSLTYLFDFKNDIAIDAGIIVASSSVSTAGLYGDADATHNSGIGLVLGAEYFVNGHFGIDVRVIPALITSGNDSSHNEWQNTIMGFGSIGAHLYL